MENALYPKCNEKEGREQKRNENYHLKLQS